MRRSPEPQNLHVPLCLLRKLLVMRFAKIPLLTRSKSGSRVQQKMPLTEVCDGDVLSSCAKGSDIELASIGSIRKCLADLVIKPTPDVSVLPPSEADKVTLQPPPLLHLHCRRS